VQVGSVKVKFFCRNAKFFHARWLGVLGAVRVGVQWVELAAWLALRTVLRGRLVGWGAVLGLSPILSVHGTPANHLLSRGGVARNRVTNRACTSTTKSANPPILAPRKPAVANSPPANRRSHHVASLWDPWSF
jgi:hypothetical protein